MTAVCEYLAAPIRALRRGLRPPRSSPCIVEPQDAVSHPAARTPRGINMVTVGGLVARKDPMACLDVLAELTARGVPATMTFVGRGRCAPTLRSVWPPTRPG